jgi:large subunit ribosomal protein L6
MVKEINREIDIPEGVEVIFDNRDVVVKYNEAEIRKKLPFSKKIKLEKKDNKISIMGKIASRKESAIAGTIEAHIRNLIEGIQKEFVYKLEICNVHFPMNVKSEGDKVIIKNFLGEKKDRTSLILKGVSCSIKGNQIELKSGDKDAVGQSAANLERATRVVKRDRRVFQDGIYIVEKEGEEI